MKWLCWFGWHERYWMPDRETAKMTYCKHCKLMFYEGGKK